MSTPLTERPERATDLVDAAQPVPQRLLQAAKICFLADDYHTVSTRRIAELAEVNVSMIRYYFGSKEGLYEEMIRVTLQPMLDVLDGEMLQTPAGFADYLRLYYRTMLATPEFPKLILKVLALHHGPGRRFIQQLLERGRTRGAKRVEALKQGGFAAPTLDPDVLRMCFVSLAMTPLLLKDVFEEQMERPMDPAFMDMLAAFNGQMIAASLATQTAQAMPVVAKEQP
ncbi:MAG: TetR/AcrR family transcriptional regulator [Leptothrix sp. (in: b-proteobacteria)]